MKNEFEPADEAMIKSEEFCRNILKSAIDGFLIVDKDGRLLEVNDAYCRMSGYSEQELLSMSISDLQASKKEDTASECIKDIVAQGTGRFETRHRRKDGQSIDVEVSSTYLPCNRGRVSFFLRDITGRKLAEIEREQYFNFFETSPDMMCRADHNGHFIKINPAGVKMLGYSLSEFISQSFIEFVHPDDRQTTLNELARQQQRGFSFDFENRYICKDGSVKWLSWHAIYNFNDLSTYATARDITEQKRMDEALRESENLLRFALEGSNDGLWDVQMNTGKTYLSPRSYEILGYLPDEGAKAVETWSDLVCPDDLPLTNERLKAHLEGRTPLFEVEQRLRMKSGDWKWVLARGKIVTWDTDGKPLRITGTHTDLTVQKMLESQLHHSQKMESIGRLAGGVAHDFNNMLSVIIGYAYLGMMESHPTHPLYAYLTEIHKAAERSAGLTQQLLTFARKQTITPVVMDLNDTVSGMFKMLRRLIGENIILEWLPAANLSLVKVDPTQVDQILANLCINASDAINGPGKITIKTENCTIEEDFSSYHAGIVPGEYVLLEVSDDGCGMDHEILAHIFEPFFTTKGVAEGTGLGLATVYGAVKMNKGFIYVDSKPGLGATFSIYLPRHANDAEQAKESAAETTICGQETIMLVDDEPAILDMTAMFLSRQGYTVLQANSPAEALRLAREYGGGISLLITDVIMPEMNGRELANNLQLLYPQLKCLFMSGYMADIIVHQGVLDEGLHFISKPIMLPDLTAKVREALDGK